MQKLNIEIGENPLNNIGQAFVSKWALLRENIRSNLCAPKI